jgi:RecA-family ATPase
MMTDKLAPGAARLAYIGQDVSRAPQGEKLSIFVERANTAGQLLRKGFFTPEVVEQELWGVAIACKLVGLPGSESEEHIASVIGDAVALVEDDDEPRANGHDASSAAEEPPPHTNIPEGADTGRETSDSKQRQDAPPSDQPPLALITPNQWKDFPLEEMRWLATHRIPADDVTILSSDGAGGKTTLGLQLAVSVACDLGDWIGTTTSTGPVIFYSAEEPEKEMRRRLDRIARKRGVDPDDIEHLHFHFAEPDEALLGISTPSGKIVPTATFHALAKSVTDTKPSLLIVDTIAAVYGGSQNDRFQVRTFINRFRRLARDTGCAVVLLDHPSLSGMSSDTGRSGTVDWRNAVRSFLYMRTIAGDDGVEERTFRELEVVKTNYGPAGEKVRLRWEDGSFVVKGSLSTPQQAAAVAKIDDVFLKLLDKLTAQGRHVRPNPGRSFAPNEFAKEREAEGVTAKAFETSMRRLLDHKKIALKTEGSPSKRTTRIIRPEVSLDV